MTESGRKSTLAIIFLLAMVAIAAAIAGCTSSAPDNSGTRHASDVYLDTYSEGMDHHMQAQDYFNYGTAAWENINLRQAIADYANASMEYNAAARSYGIMAGSSDNRQDREFAESLKGCAYNLSLAADDFMNAAIALQQNNTDEAYKRFNDGQARVDNSDMMLNRSIELTPAWMLNMTSA